MGVFGGFIGEVVRFIEKFFEILLEKQIPGAFEVLDKIVQVILDTFLIKGTFEIEIDENCLKQLIELDPAINIDILRSANKTKHAEIIEILKKNLCGILTNLVLNRPDVANLNIRQKIIELILKYSIEQEKG